MFFSALVGPQDFLLYCEILERGAIQLAWPVRFVSSCFSKACVFRM